MDLPASVTDLGEQLRATAEITPDPDLFHDADVFAAERERIFTRPLIAADHETRLSTDRSYFRCDAAPRGLIVTRDTAGQLHALRNVCIHAGYPVCDAEEGVDQRLICPYHGWEFALDGRLIEPVFSSRIDPSRLRLAEYPVEVCNGLILVDLSGKSAAAGQNGKTVPAWLATAKVVARTKHSTTWNWKFLHNFLQSSSHLFFVDLPDTCLEFGPLSFMIVQGQRAFLLRLIPRFAEQTDFHVIEMAGEQAPEKSSVLGGDPVADGLRCADTSLGWFDRRIADRYCSLMGAVQ
jgi:nitrite reductase/ring-hydroxylating ferredoxin subunit